MVGGLLFRHGDEFRESSTKVMFAFSPPKVVERFGSSRRGGGGMEHQRLETEESVGTDELGREKEGGIEGILMAAMMSWGRGRAEAFSKL